MEVASWTSTREGRGPPAMTQEQWSDDRQWWWDGGKWVPASQAPPEAQRSPPEILPSPPVRRARGEQHGPRQGQWSDDRQWWWNGSDWMAASQAPQEAQKVDRTPTESASTRSAWSRHRGLWGTLAVLAVIALGISTIAVANVGNQLKKAVVTSTPAANAPKAATSVPPRVTATANTVGTCEPQPCANDNNGWIASVSNIRYDIASNNEFEKPQGGNVFVAVDVAFTNKLKQPRQANPADFVLVDGSGMEQPLTFIDSCVMWNPENVAPGASYGPTCLAFEATAGKPNGLVLVWTPTTGSGTYKMKVS
jgi:Domain of unknown function (DUF4352)